MIWFYTLCVTAIAIVIADANVTLEPAVNKFEEKIGIRRWSAIVVGFIGVLIVLNPSLDDFNFFKLTI